MIEIDGSHKEGGGQIIRTALALSALTGKPFTVNNIRAKRPKPGLKNQHLYCIKALQQLCDAEVIGAEPGSLEVDFTPKKFKAKNIKIDIGTAGSITLLLQSLLVPCMFGNKMITLTINGGTDVKWSPQIGYLKNVILPMFNCYAEIKCNLLKRGYYPKGGGKVEIIIKPRFNLEEIIKKPIELIEQGKIVSIKGVSHASVDLEKAHVADRVARNAEILLRKFNVPVHLRSEYCNTLSTGCGITVYGMFSKDGKEIDNIKPIRIGVDILGEKGKKAEKVGKDCAEKLIEEIEKQTPVDEHLCDNLIPLLGLTKGKIKTSKISDHTLTNIYVTEKFLDVKFKVDKKNNIIKL